jgi:DNA-binding response OmpR family regulator
MTQKILLIDDDLNILFALAILLEEEGYQIWTAENGVQGFEMIKAQGMPDLILLDRRMPTMNGVQFLEEFRAAYGLGVPIIMMTAAGDIETCVSNLPIQGWLSKPFLLASLLLLIRSNLGNDLVVSWRRY